MNGLIGLDKRLCQIGEKQSRQIKESQLSVNWLQVTNTCFKFLHLSNDSDNVGFLPISKGYWQMINKINFKNEAEISVLCSTAHNSKPLEIT